VALDLGTDEGWFESQLVVTLLLCSAIGFCYFIVWELGDRHPIVDFGLFRNRNFLVGAVGGSLLYGAFFGATVLLPLVLQTQLGYTATWAGLVLAPVGVIPVLTTRILGRNMYRLDPRKCTSASLIIVGIVMWMRSRFSTEADLWTVTMPQVVLGVGLVLMSTPLASLTLSQLKGHETASALGVSVFMRYAAGSFGASLMTSLWQHREALHHTRLAEAVTNSGSLTREALTTLGSQGFSPQQVYGILDGALSQQSWILAADDVFRVSAWFTVVLVSLVWLAKPPFNFVRAAVPVD
jgi:DHA2 family multidrug resistance protein